MNRLLGSTALAAVALMSLSVSAQAQDVAIQTNTPSATEVDDVIVSARRREEKLKDVPVAAAVLTSGALADRGGVTSALEMTAGQPGVRFFDTSSPVNSEISIRASPTARATSSDPSVGLYRNGAYVGGGAVGGRSFSRMDLFDIDQVEILRGTQGALYGRNAVGGAANIISAKPAFENSGQFDARYAFENEASQIQAVGNFQASDNVAVRLGVDWADQSGGFFYNPHNDVYFDHHEAIGLRGQVRWRNDSTDVNLLVEKMESDVPAITYQVSIPASAAFPKGYVQPDYEYNWNTAPKATQDVQGAILGIVHDFSWGRLTSTTLYRERKSFYQVDADGVSPADLARDTAAGLVRVPIDPNQGLFVPDDTVIFTQDLHLTGMAYDGRMNWLAGIELLKLDSDYQVENTRTPTAANRSTGTISPVDLSYSSWAVYGSMGYDLTDAFNLSLEGRYTSDDKSMTSRLYDRDTGLPVGGAGFVVDAETSPDNVSYNLIGSYRFSPAVMAYAKVGSSYRAGGFNANLGVPQQPVKIPAAYDDETATSFELGLKGDLVDGLTFALSTYRTLTDDLIIQTDNGCRLTNPTCTLQATSFLTNAGEAESWGFEAELSGSMTVGSGRLRFTGGVSNQHGEVTSGIYKGQELAQVPEWILGADINYRMPIANFEGFANLNYTGQRGGYQELVLPNSTSPNFDLPEIDLINARVGVDFGSFEVALFAQNLTDNTYVIFQAPTSRRLNTPRNFGVQIRKRW